MGADACPVPEGQGSWLETSVLKLTTEAPVNGGRNYDGQLLGPSLKKTICWNSHSPASLPSLAPRRDGRDGREAFAPREKWMFL